MLNFYKTKDKLTRVKVSSILGKHTANVKNSNNYSHHTKGHPSESRKYKHVNKKYIILQHKDDWIKKMWYIYTMEYYSVIKRMK